MKLIVGLGNPGRRYAETRHNAGFMAADRLAQRHALAAGKSKFHAETIDATIADQRVMLMKPQTYMNRSGLSVGEATRFFQIAPSDVLVLVDDTALPVGLIRLRPGGSSGGHNGLEDIRKALGTQKFPRLRIGVGEPIVGDRRVPQHDYVLAPFTETQRKALAPALNDAADAMACWLESGIEEAMNRYNRRADAADSSAATESRETF